MPPLLPPVEPPALLLELPPEVLPERTQLFPTQTRLGGQPPPQPAPVAPPLLPPVEVPPEVAPPEEEPPPPLLEPPPAATQTPPAQIWFGAQTGQPPPWQLPVRQLAPAGQAFPQPPQFCGSRPRSAQPLPQGAVPAGQTHCSAWQTSTPAQSALLLQALPAPPFVPPLPEVPPLLEAPASAAGVEELQAARKRPARRASLRRGPNTGESVAQALVKLHTGPATLPQPVRAVTCHSW